MKTNIEIGKNKNKYFEYNMLNYPNLLITGLDDYSKSDLINNILYQLLLNNNQNEIKILPIDVKGIDYKLFDNNNHFMSPIITEGKYVDDVLEGLLKEIEIREKTKDIQPIIITLISEFDDMMLDCSDRVLPLLEEILKRGKSVNVFTILSTLYLDEDNYSEYVYRHFDLVASFFDRSKSKFNKFKFRIPNDCSFNLISNDKKINKRLKNIIVKRGKIEEMLRIDK